jgi:hypothetical protein
MALDASSRATTQRGSTGSHAIFTDVNRDIDDISADDVASPIKPLKVKTIRKTKRRSAPSSPVTQPVEESLSDDN